MKTFTYFPLEDPRQHLDSPIAIFSADIIHILYPNGEVEVTTTELIERRQTKMPLDKCLVWGYFEEF
ncbi:MAG: hypothetical protein ACM37W_23680 [Actinomycetota bacterium]